LKKKTIRADSYIFGNFRTVENLRFAADFLYRRTTSDSIFAAAICTEDSESG
jgi:hypothetical protein